MIATDQETGLVARVGPPATVFPGAMALGAAAAPTTPALAYAITGRELRAIGINTDYAPDADVNVNPANPVIGVRSFSSDPKLVAKMVAARSRAAGGRRVTATAKHFPGHGDTGADSHVAADHHPHPRAVGADRRPAVPGRHQGRRGRDHDRAHVASPPSTDRATRHAQPQGADRGAARRAGFKGVIATDSLRMEGVRDVQRRRDRHPRGRGGRRRAARPRRRRCRSRR